MATWTAATGVEPLDNDSEEGQRIAHDLTVALVETRAAIAQRARVAEIKDGAHAGAA